MSERSPSLKIEAAVEIYFDPAFDLWPTLGAIPGGHISLSGDLTDEQIGSVIHASLHWFYYDDEQQPAATVEEYLGRVTNREAEGTAVIVWGGPAFTDTVAGITMMPGCCVALDERDEVYGFLAGRSEFACLGHSPDTGLEMDADQILITQHDDEGLVLATLECPRDQLDAALAVMESDIDAFLAALPAWATRHVPTHAAELSKAVAEGLRISESSEKP
ncbi:hypothetical protein ACFU7D_20600 [Nocardioides sp. NPDC057577]|uniref:hypothetical protein n=1 Tax=Nocardioides sp. NPDC057577 TaxID=3346171 RepID=UPI00366CBC09